MVVGVHRPRRGIRLGDHGLSLPAEPRGVDLVALHADRVGGRFPRLAGASLILSVGPLGSSHPILM